MNDGKKMQKLYQLLFGLGVLLMSVGFFPDTPHAQQEPTQIAQELRELAQQGMLTVRALRAWGMLPDHFVSLALALQAHQVDLLGADVTQVREIADLAAADDALATYAPDLRELAVFMAQVTDTPDQDTPMAAVERLVAAQATGDPDAVRAVLATRHLDAQARQDLQKVVERVAPMLQLKDIKLNAVAVGVNEDVGRALVRYEYAVIVSAENETISQRGANMALVLREGGVWKVAQTWADELLTMEVMADELVPVVNGWTKKQPDLVHFAYQSGLSASDSGFYKVAQGGGGGSFGSPDPLSLERGLTDLRTANQVINQTVRTQVWDDRQLLLDSAGSAAGAVPIVGDLYSNWFTIMGTLKTIQNLPQTVRDGHVQATMLDVALISWAPVQVVAEFVPGVDHLTDAVAAGVSQMRYNSIQRDNYLSIRLKMLNMDFSDLAKHLLSVPTAEYAALVESEKPKEIISGSRYEWHGDHYAPHTMRIVNDALVLNDPRLVFEVGAQWVVKQSESQAMHDAFLHMGARRTSIAASDSVAVLMLRFTPQVVESIAKGDEVLRGFHLRSFSGRPYVVYELSCNRGVQEIAVTLRDGSVTAPVTIENLVFNAIKAVAVEFADGRRTEEVSIPEGETLERLRFVPIWAEDAPDGLALSSLVGHPCLTFQELDDHPEPVIQDRMRGTWPNADLDFTALRTGEERVLVQWPGGEAYGSLESILVFRGEENSGFHRGELVFSIMLDEQEIIEMRPKTYDGPGCNIPLTPPSDSGVEIRLRLEVSPDGHVTGEMDAINFHWISDVSASATGVFKNGRLTIDGIWEAETHTRVSHINALHYGTFIIDVELEETDFKYFNLKDLGSNATVSTEWNSQSGGIKSGKCEYETVNIRYHRLSF
ncbi:nuclear transport factor 2 family protein [Desulfonatronum lacustre]|uniref:nuclear transport factor 2 family protein n=1 Tax=Desulfonatronum lacustre TaxID=66849 RepID=UPI0012EC5961|nr:nuclear transport factor 2 family protein [Desulfonatronum lacustre]